MKFHLKHHWGGLLAALGFGLDLITTLVSMVTLFPWGFYMEILASTIAPTLFDWIFFIPAGNEFNHKIWDGFEFKYDPTREKSP